MYSETESCRNRNKNIVQISCPFVGTTKNHPKQKQKQIELETETTETETVAKIDVNRKIKLGN